MEISLTPDVEARLNRIASQMGRGVDQVVQDLVSNYLEHDEWFRQEVGKGLASLDQDKFVSHEEVRKQMERITTLAVTPCNLSLASGFHLLEWFDLP